MIWSCTFLELAIPCTCVNQRRSRLYQDREGTNGLADHQRGTQYLNVYTLELLKVIISIWRFAANSLDTESGYLHEVYKSKIPRCWLDFVTKRHCNKVSLSSINHIKIRLFVLYICPWLSLLNWSRCAYFTHR